MNEPKQATNHADPHVLGREICVLRYVLDRHAGEKPDDTFAVFEDGGTRVRRAEIDAYGLSQRCLESVLREGLNHALIRSVNAVPPGR